MRLQRVFIARGMIAVALALLVGVVGVGCDDLTQSEGGAIDLLPTSSSDTGVEGDSTTSTQPAVSSTDGLVAPTTAPPATTPTTQALSSAETLLPNGHIKAAGIIDDAWQDAGGRHLRIDYVDVLSWDEAVAAGLVDPNNPHDGFWYSNVNSLLREFDVSTSADIFTSYRGLIVDPDTPCTWADFMSFWAPSPPPGDDYMHGELWWIERDGNTVVWISQQFIP